MGNSKSNIWLDWVKAFIIALIVTLLVKHFFISPVVVDGQSMQPTLHDRDRMIVNKFTYRFKQPERFDIIIFHNFDQRDFIKRVIGLPGEHVEVKDNILYINGEAIDQPFLENEKEASISFPIITRDFTLEQLRGNYDVIPEGYVLVLGDNRGDSTDSRYLGLISMEQIVGKTNVIYWPIKRVQKVK